MQACVVHRPVVLLAIPTATDRVRRSRQGHLFRRPLGAQCKSVSWSVTSFQRCSRDIGSSPITTKEWSRPRFAFIYLVVSDDLVNPTTAHPFLVLVFGDGFASATYVSDQSLRPHSFE